MRLGFPAVLIIRITLMNNQGDKATNDSNNNDDEDGDVFDDADNSNVIINISETNLQTLNTSVHLEIAT